MAHQGSYHVESFAISLEAEIRRLDAQVDLFWPVESAVIRRFGLRDGMDVLDCGCGPGRLIELLRGDYASLTCAGVEIDGVLVEYARKRVLAGGATDVRIVEGSAENSNLEEESFDFILMRLVLEHIPDPLFAIQQLSKLLRPGGRIVIISNDFDFHLRTWPPVPELDELYAAYCASRRADGGDPCIGRRLPALLTEAGLNVVGFEIETAHNAIVGDEAFLRAEGAGIPAQLVRSGYLAEEVYRRMVASWKNMLRHPDHSILRPLFVAAAERPRAGESRSRGEITAASRSQGTSVPDRLDLDFVPPSPGLEEEIASIWRGAMGLDQVGVTANFFDLGGDSLMLEEIGAALERRLSRELPIATLFQFPTIQSLARHITEEDASEDQSDGDGVSDGIADQAQRRRDAAARRRRGR